MTPRDAYNRCTNRMLDVLSDPSLAAHPRTLRALVAAECLAEGSRSPTPTGRRVLQLRRKGEPRDARGQCKVCGAHRRIRNDGAIGAHHGDDEGWCSGGAQPDTPRGPKRIGPTVQISARIPLAFRECVSEVGPPRAAASEALVRWLVARGADEDGTRATWGVPERIDLGDPIGDVGPEITAVTWCLPTAGVAQLDAARGSTSRAKVIREALAEALT